MTRLLTTVKNAFVPAGTEPRTIPIGLMSGIKFNLDLKHGMQVFVGLSEVELAPWFRRFSAGIRTAIDVGAHDGYYTLYLLAKSGAEKVFAFEPDPVPRARFDSNLALNKLDGSPRLHFSTKFVGSKDDDVHQTLDSVAGVELPCLVKLDIEGAEMEALRGATKLLEQPQTRWIIEVHSRQLEVECRALLESKGYTVRAVPKSFIRAVIPEHRPHGYNSWIVAFTEPAFAGNDARA